MEYRNIELVRDIDETIIFIESTRKKFVEVLIVIQDTTSNEILDETTKEMASKFVDLENMLVDKLKLKLKEL